MTDQTGLLKFRFTITSALGGGWYFSLDNKLLRSAIPGMVFKPVEEPPAVTGNEQESASGVSAGFDRRIVGKWLYTERHPGSTDYWSYTSQVMIISSAGKISIYEETIAANTSDSYVRSSPGKLIGTFKLLTKNGHFYTVQPQTKQEILIAKYTVDGSRLLTVAADGKKQLWNKQ